MSGAVLEPPPLVAGLDDVAEVRQAVEQRGRHLGVAKYAGPFAERQVGCHDDRGLLVDPSRFQSIGTHEWECVNVYNRWYYVRPALSKTQTSSFGVMIVVRTFARVMLTRKF